MDEHGDGCAGITAPEANVVQPTVVAKTDSPSLVDDVATHPVVADSPWSSPLQRKQERGRKREPMSLGSTHQ